MADFSERHARKGLMSNRRPGSVPDGPFASTVVCDRQECQDKARFWVQGVTGEAATDADNRADAIEAGRTTP